MEDYFCGRYFKCQNDAQTIALIPACHIANGEKSCSIQLITADASWIVTFPCSDYRQTDSAIEIAGNHFGSDGIVLNLNAPGLAASGHLSFGSLTPIRYDIMGPFQYIPFMECRHSIFSMKHSVNGCLEINGVACIFHNGTGYIEGDRGRSFPKNYIWTQCCFPEGSVMLSVAEIPFLGFHFTGIIGLIHYCGKEYRIATYLGAKVVQLQAGTIIVKQGNKQLTVRLLEKHAQPLAAPVQGTMIRTIHESAVSKASYHFQFHGRTVFAFESNCASFEYEYPQ